MCPRRSLTTRLTAPKGDGGTRPASPTKWAATPLAAHSHSDSLIRESQTCRRAAPDQRGYDFNGAIRAAARRRGVIGRVSERQRKRFVTPSRATRYAEHESCLSHPTIVERRARADARNSTGQQTVRITILGSFNALPTCFLRAARRNRLRVAWRVNRTGAPGLSRKQSVSETAWGSSPPPSSSSATPDEGAVAHVVTAPV